MDKTMPPPKEWTAKLRDGHFDSDPQNPNERKCLSFAMVGTPMSVMSVQSR